VIPASSWVTQFTDMKTGEQPVPFDKLADFNSAAELVRAIQQDAIKWVQTGRDGEDGVNR